MPAPASTPASVTGTLTAADGAPVAYRQVPGEEPTILLLHGFGGSQQGRKSRYLETLAREQGLGFVALDLSGHGADKANLAEGTIGGWVEQVGQALDTLVPGHAVLAGTSMGAWVALRTAEERPDKVAGIVTISAAPDFTRRIAAGLDPGDRALLRRGETVWMPNDFAPEQPTPLSAKLVNEAEKHLMLNRPVRFDGPVRLVHGAADAEDPVACSERLLANLTARDKSLTVVPAAEHLMNRPQDLAAIGQATGAVIEAVRHRPAAPGPAIAADMPAPERRQRRA